MRDFVNTHTTFYLFRNDGNGTVEQLEERAERHGVDPAVRVHVVLCQRLDEIEIVVVVGIGDGIVPEEILHFDADEHDVSDKLGGDKSFR